MFHPTFFIRWTLVKFCFRSNILPNILLGDGQQCWSLAGFCNMLTCIVLSVVRWLRAQLMVANSNKVARPILPSMMANVGTFSRDFSGNYIKEQLRPFLGKSVLKWEKESLNRKPSEVLKKIHFSCFTLRKQQRHWKHILGAPTIKEHLLWKETRQLIGKTADCSKPVISALF